MLRTLGNALVCSRYQNMLHRYSDLVEIANLSNMSDSLGGGQLQPGPGSLYKIPSYDTQGLYQRAAGSFPLGLERSSALSSYLREPDLDATLSADGKTLRIYGVNSTPVPRSVRFALPSSFAPVEATEVFVVADSNPVADSEAMNSRDDPHRVAPQRKKADFRGREFEYRFAPFAVTLLELQLTNKK
jgi:alpha-L-arabinofuranosidase